MPSSRVLLYQLLLPSTFAIFLLPANMLLQSSSKQTITTTNWQTKKKPHSVELIFSLLCTIFMLPKLWFIRQHSKIWFLWRFLIKLPKSPKTSELLVPKVHSSTSPFYLFLFKVRFIELFTCILNSPFLYPSTVHWVLTSVLVPWCL